MRTHDLIHLMDLHLLTVFMFRRGLKSSLLQASASSSGSQNGISSSSSPASASFVRSIGQYFQNDLPSCSDVPFSPVGAAYAPGIASRWSWLSSRSQRGFASMATSVPAPPSGYVPVSIGTLQPRARRPVAYRPGRGPGGGSRFAGRGLKGMKARYSVHPLFEGGRVRFADRIPKVGFKNRNKLILHPTALGRVVEAIKQGQLDPDQLITMKALRDAGCAQVNIKDGIQLILKGFRLEESDLLRLPPLHFEVSRCSARARKLIEAAGGSVTKVYYSRFCLYAMLEPERWWRVGKPLPRPARPKPRHAHKYQAVGSIPAPTAIPEDRVRARAHGA